MLILIDDLLIARGGMRVCYRHPDDKSRCVKVYRQLSEIPLTAVAKTFRILLGGQFNRFNINVQEYRFWLSLIDNEEVSSVLHPYIPHIDGVVQSNRGVGLVEELFLDGNGDPSRNLLQLKGELSKDQLLQIRIELLKITDCVIKHALPMYDWNPANILVVQNHKHCKVKIPDLEGEMANKEWIKISRWSASARRQKLQRRINRFYTYFDSELLAQSKPICGAP